MKKIYSVLFTLVLLLGLCLLPSTPVVAAQWNVEPGESIQDAIDNAAPGDTIIVEDGVYVEDLVVDTAGLTLRSENGTEDTVIQLVDGVGIDIQDGAGGFILGGAVGQGFSILSSDDGESTTFNIQLANAPAGVTISYNFIDTTGDATMGISVGAAGATDLTIANNEFLAEEGDGSIWGPKLVDVQVENNNFIGPGGFVGGYAVEFAGVTSTPGTSTIAGNDIDGYGMGVAIFNGEGTSDLTIEGNDITGCTNGIRLGQYSPGTNGDMTTVTVTENELTGNNIGIRINDGANVLASQLIINNNNIDGNTTWGLQNQHTTEVVIAEDNWWGDAAGPYHEAGNHGDGDAVTDNVDYCPWLDDEWPNGQQTGPVINLDSGQWYCAIQPAIDAANEGDTITVLPGLYNEFIQILTDGLTVMSTDGPEDTVIHPTPLVTALPAPPEPDVVVYINASGVCFEGFTVEVDGDEWLGTPDTGIAAEGYVISQNVDGALDDVSILDNIVYVDNVEEAWGIGVYGFDGTIEVDGNEVELGEEGESVAIGHGVEVIDCETVLITDNEVEVWAEWIAEGIQTLACYTVKILDNTVQADVVVMAPSDVSATRDPMEMPYAMGIGVNCISGQEDTSIQPDGYMTFKAQVNGNTVDASVVAPFGWANGIGALSFERGEIGNDGNTVTVDTAFDLGGMAEGMWIQYGGLLTAMNNTVDVIVTGPSQALGMAVLDIEISEIGENDVTVDSDIVPPVLAPSIESLPAQLETPIAAVEEIVSEMVGSLSDGERWLWDALGIWVGRGPSDGEIETTGLVDFDIITEVHDNTVDVDVDAEFDMGEFIDTLGGISVVSLLSALDFGILIDSAMAPEVENNDVSADANIINRTTIPPLTLDDGEPFLELVAGAGIAIAQGITLYGCYPLDDDTPPTVDGNSAEANADVEVDVINVPWLLLADGSALAQLQSELDVLYDIVQQTIDEGGTSLSTPAPPEIIACAAGGGLSIALGINALNCPLIQVVNNELAKGNANVDTWIFADGDVGPVDAGALGAGLAIGMGIRCVDCPMVNIADNGQEEGVMGLASASSNVSAVEGVLLDTASIGGAVTIGIGIRVRGGMLRDAEAEGIEEPLVTVTGNNVIADGTADTTVDSIIGESGEDCGCAFSLGGSLGVGLGISIGDAAIFTGEADEQCELSPAIIIADNQVDSAAQAGVNAEAASVCSEDPMSIGGAVSMAAGISLTPVTWRADILDNTLTADALADTITVANEEQPLELDVLSMGGSIAAGMGIMAADGWRLNVSGNDALAGGLADCDVTAVSEIPLDIGEAESLAAGIGCGLTILGVVSPEVEWNHLYGDGEAVVTATADATYDLSLELGFGFSAGALALDTGFSEINYNDLLTGETGGAQLEEEGMAFGLYHVGKYFRACYNWWGDPTGPSGRGIGFGEAIEWQPEFLDISYYPWLSHPIADLLEDNVGYYGFYKTLQRGWCTLSTPVPLEDADFEEIDDISQGIDFDIAYYYDPTQPEYDRWQQVEELYPLDGIYIHMLSDDVVFFTSSPDPYAPVRDLEEEQSWYLIGPTPYDECFPFTTSMPADQALVTLEENPEGNKGLNQLVSPSIGGQDPWAWVPGMEPVPDMESGYGYWAFMENADTLAGFVFSPLSIEMPPCRPCQPPTLDYWPMALCFTVCQQDCDEWWEIWTELEIWNDGSGTLHWSANDDAAWLNLNPTSGTAAHGEPSYVEVLINAWGMEAGTYMATITLTAPGSTNTPQTIPVTLVVKEPTLVTTLAATDVNGSGAILNGRLDSMGGSDQVNVWFEWWDEDGEYWDWTPVQTMNVAGEFSFELSGLDNCETHYFQAYACPASGYLDSCPYYGDDCCSSGDVLEFATDEVIIDYWPWAVCATVCQQGCDQWWEVEVELEISNYGCGTLNWSAASDAPWLNLSQTTGTVAGEDTSYVYVWMDAWGMEAGTYMASITLSDPEAINTPQTIPVTLVVIEPTLVTTLPADFPVVLVTGYSAMLNGRLDSMGGSDQVKVRFEWWDELGNSGSTPLQTMNATGDFSYQLDGLATDITYYFQACGCPAEELLEGCPCNCDNGDDFEFECCSCGDELDFIIEQPG